jgi:hypothetical protein
MLMLLYQKSVQRLITGNLNQKGLQCYCVSALIMPGTQVIPDQAPAIGDKKDVKRLFSRIIELTACTC